MPQIEYVPRNFGQGSLLMIEQATDIASDYAAQGYDLTLRQLYYQFVARGLMENKQTEYKRLGSVLNDARLAGLFDWSYMVDRTRNLAGGDVDDTTPKDALQRAVDYYAIPMWDGQPTRVEVWVEKEALVGVVERAANQTRTPYFACRGYVSQSELWSASQRLEAYLDDGAERIVVLHLGDHDPSGIDMTRDMTDRLETFLDVDGYDIGRLEFRRVALNMDQVRQYSPPPNPAKETDSRHHQYMARYGRQSWELDALDPATLDALINANVRAELDVDQWNARRTQQEVERAQLQQLVDQWDQPDDVTD